MIWLARLEAWADTPARIALVIGVHLSVLLGVAIALVSMWYLAQGVAP